MSRREFLGATAAAVLGIGAAVLLSRQQAQAADAPLLPAIEPGFDWIGGGTGTMPYSASLDGRRLIQNFEGLRLTAYQEPNGSYSIGYGHNGPDVLAGQVITLAQAEALFDQDIAEAEAAVSSAVQVALSQPQFDALVSFVYNVGAGNFSRSTLLAKLNAGDYLGAANEFTRWQNVGRRIAEANLFRSGTVA